MGYSGACYLLQEVCNSLFDALFNILPLGSELDDVTPTLAKQSLTWANEAEVALDEYLEEEPILVRISAAKRLRDAAEQNARGNGAVVVDIEHIRKARNKLSAGGAA